MEIEMTEIEHEHGSCHSPTAGVLRTSEYAGSREGTYPHFTASGQADQSYQVLYHPSHLCQLCPVRLAECQCLSCDLIVAL